MMFVKTYKASYLRWMVIFFTLLNLAFLQEVPSSPSTVSIQTEPETPPIPVLDTQNSKGATVNSNTLPGGDGGDVFSFSRVATRFEFWLAMFVVGFGVIVMFVVFALIRTRDFSANDILKLVAITQIVIGTLFLISAGFGDQQIAPAMGLFGTVAGYLLGRVSNTDEVTKKAKPDDETKGGV